MVDEKQKIERVHCNKCLHRTKHLVVVERSQVEEELVEGRFSISWHTKYTMLECCGCENVTLRRLFYFSEWGPDEFEEEYYPPLISRRLPEWYKDLPDEWKEMLKEVYTALHADSRCLALMGTRTLVDLYLNHQVGDVGSFTAKVKTLEKQGLISKPNKEFLETALEAGHAAAHRGHKPKVDEVNQVIDIVENLLQSYVLVNVTEELKQKIPARKQESKGTDS